MANKQVWVSPDSKGGWRVHNADSKRDTAHFNNKAHAVDTARGIAQNQKAELITQRRDGRISERNSYGRDPFPPKG